MTARRAARSHRPPAPKIRPASGSRPAVIEVGPLVEVWGPDDEVPAGTGNDARAYFEAAIGRYRYVWNAVEPPLPNQHRHAPDAWSLDRRCRPDLRLRSVYHDPSIDPIARLAGAGCSLADIDRLRADAQRLIGQVSDAEVERRGVKPPKLPPAGRPLLRSPRTRNSRRGEA